MKVTLNREPAVPCEVWIDRGEVLTVLAIVNQSDGSKLLLWSSRQEAVALFPASSFDVVDGRLPPQWEASVNASGHVELSPKEWKTPGFWEAYHDGALQAEELFHSIADSIVAAS